MDDSRTHLAVGHDLEGGLVFFPSEGCIGKVSHVSKGSGNLVTNLR